MAKLHVPLDVHYADDPKIIEAGERAELLYVRGLAFAKRMNSDGVITDSQLARFGFRDARKRAEKLTEVNLWSRIEGGYVITTWLKHNKSAAEIAQLSEARAQAGQQGGRPSQKQIALAEESKPEKPENPKRREEREKLSEEKQREEIVFPTGTLAQPSRTRALSKAETLADHHLAELQPTLARGGSYDLLAEFRKVWEVAWQAAVTADIQPNVVGQRLAARFIATVTGAEPDYARAAQLVNRFGKVALLGIDQAIKNRPDDPYSYAWTVCSAEMKAMEIA